MLPAPTSVYVHVPFCVVKCGYCDFNSYVVEDGQIHDLFLEALDRELAMAILPSEPVSVFVGGGTPTLLDEPRFTKMWEILGRHLPLSACPEVTVEGNPESVTESKIRSALDAGVTRVSLGAQSFRAEQLEFLDRAHDGDGVRRAVSACRAAGADNVSLDLIFGVPGQTEAQWREDLDAALALEPDHISAYALIFEPGTRLTHEFERGLVQPIDEAVEGAMFGVTRELLGARGYDAYEISNFAGRGGPCRHNDHYWLQGDYVGVGPGASGHRQGTRSTNLKGVEAWARAALRGVPPVESAETLTPDQRFGEALWLGLRRRDGVDVTAIAARLGAAVPDAIAAELDRAVDDGLLEWHERRIARLTGRGVLMADSVNTLVP